MAEGDPTKSVPTVYSHQDGRKPSIKGKMVDQGVALMNNAVVL
jgi:hypothetical protein